MENNIKKQWLISFIAVTCTTCLSAFFSKTLGEVLLVLLLASLGFITYYLSYLKHDFYWLTAVISVRAISLLVTAGTVVFLAFTKQLMNFVNNYISSLNVSPVIYSIYWILGMLINIYYMYWSYQLRKLNMKKVNNQQKKKKTA